MNCGPKTNGHLAGWSLFNASGTHPVETAYLDQSTEEAIADLIEKVPITRIVVAHRPALIRRAKRVFLVKDRQITELPRRDPAVVEPLRGRT